MRFKRIALGGAALAVAAAFIATQSVSVEEPAYRTVEKSGPFELRDYPALVAAETTVEGGQKQAAERGFRILAAYIFGANKGAQKIAMTAPVAQRPAGEKLAMAAPVAQTLSGSKWVVRFTMPRGYTLQTLPQPDDLRVRLVDAPAVRVAVIRFSGLAEPGAVEAQTAQLTSWIKARGLKPTAGPSLAQYNPPWTLPFLRRNEVMIPVEA